MEERPTSDGGDTTRPPRSNSSDGVSIWSQTMGMASLWTEILASILGLGLVGWLLDRWLGWFPWLTVTGLIIGSIGGVYNAVRKAQRVFGHDEGDDHKP